jgi:hypothetical protein
LGLLIDIQTLLKLVKFNDDFRNLFYALSFWTSEHKRLIENYVVNTDVLAKETIWKELSTSDFIPEINYIIKKWRELHVNYQDIEKQVELMKEGKKGHSLVGKVIKFDSLYKYPEVVKYVKSQDMAYNGFKLLPVKSGFLQMFF